MRPALLIAGGLTAVAVVAGTGLYFGLAEPRAAPAVQQARQPTDGRGWILLARRESDRGRYLEAAEAYGKGVAASRKVAADAAVWCEYADAVGMAQGRRLAGRPAELIARALATNPNHRCVLEMAGSLAYETQDYATAARYWRALLTQLAPGDSEYRELAAAVARAEALARG